MVMGWRGEGTDPKIAILGACLPGASPGSEPRLERASQPLGTCLKIKDPQIVQFRSIRFYHSKPSFGVRLAFGTEMDGKLAKHLGFNQISSNLHQVFPRSHISTRKISYRIPTGLRSFSHTT